MKNKLIFIAALTTILITAVIFLLPVSKLDSTKQFNQYQIQANNLNTLQINETLRTSALNKAIELCESNTFEHTRPNQQSFETIFTSLDESKSFNFFGENLARKFKKNMLGEWTHVGVATITCDKDGFIYSVQHFGRIK